MVDLVVMDDKLSLGASGGPQYSTNVVVKAGGFEVRNKNWTRPRYRYSWDYTPRPISEMQDIVTFFHGRLGRHRSFLLTDHGDYKSAAAGSDTTALDQTIGTGNGITTTFQLVKLYSDSLNPYSRVITNPKGGTVKVAVNGAIQTLGQDFSASVSTGIVTFIGSPPPTGTITAGFEFYVPVRFDVDQIEVSVMRRDDPDADEGGLAVIRGLTAIEVRV